MNEFHQLKGHDLFAMTVFLSAAKSRSFRATAIEFDVTPSAISHSIKNLEERLGVRLFNRTTRSVALTDAGERLAAKLRHAITSVADAMHEVEDSRDTPSGTVRINTSDVAMRMILRPILARFLSTQTQPGWLASVNTPADFRGVLSCKNRQVLVPADSLKPLSVQSCRTLLR